MPILKKEPPKEKSSLHPRNKHRQRYDFNKLIESCPELAPFVQLNPYNDLSVDFFNPKAVLMLNKALLMHYYDIVSWELPQRCLCPPIPGRADYIHYIADLLASTNRGLIPTGLKIKCLDLGVGANCVYPIIGNKEYQWSFIGSDIDPLAIASAQKIIENNPALEGKLEVRLQRDPKNIFVGILHKGELIDISICNPPFHASAAEARAGTLRKLSKLSSDAHSKPLLNFGGQNNELWCEGGEAGFVGLMIQQSKLFARSCLWFSSLISKQANLHTVYDELKKAKAVEVKTIPMGQGNKISRIVAWTFLSEEERANWAEKRWRSS